MLDFGVQALTLAVLKRLDTCGDAIAEALARELDSSAAEIWRCVDEASAAGVGLRVSRSKVISLAAPLDWLDAAAIERDLAGSGLQLDIVDCCGSTNTELLARMRRSPESGQVLAAELQTAGRGRQGRDWQSALCRSLAFSLSWRFELPLASLAGLSLAAGVGIVRALRAQSIEAELKWPNDILWCSRKLGGILIETLGGARVPSLAVIGVGINVDLRPEERASIGQPVCDLQEASASRRSRGDWLVVLLTELARVLCEFEREGFERLRREWERYHAHANRPVDLVLPDGERSSGIARGIDADGRLLVAGRAGVRAIAGGDVTLRARE
jgi:BirA family biotin operon repressor/biotin-[acetyl-CoA-carboxylase] ligase